MKPIFNKNIGYSIRHVLLVFVFIFTLATAYIGSASAQETGQIDVLVKGHDGHSTMNALLINSSNFTVENITSKENSFIFENLSIGKQYLILVNYKGINYPAIILVNLTSQEIPIQVFELTTSDEDIRLDFHHISFARGEDYLNVTEYLQYRNYGDTVINNTDIKIEIPNGFSNFIWNQACCLEPTDFGIFFNPIEPLRPNETHTINFKYRLDPNINEYVFEKRQYYDTSVVIITLDPDVLDVISVNNLESEGLIEIADDLVNAYSSINVFSGNGFSITVTGYKSSEINLLWIGTGVLVVLGAGGIVYAFRRSGTSIEQLKSEEDILTSELKDIEKDFADGNIIEVEYLKLKLENKITLEQVKDRIREQEKVEKNS